MSGTRSGRSADRILDVAERLVQVRGYNAFSYADVAEALGIQKASLHHHYSTKADLGLALVERYRRTFLDALCRIETEKTNALERLEQYVDLYRTVLRRGRMCMCGMLAADVATLPKAMRAGITGFFEENEAWLLRVLEAGRDRGEIRLEGPSGSMATLLVSSLEGAMFVVRANGKLDQFDEVVERLLDRVRPPEKPKRSRKT